MPSSVKASKVVPNRTIAGGEPKRMILEVHTSEGDGRELWWTIYAECPGCGINEKPHRHIRHIGGKKYIAKKWASL
jgi:hypothetical protein